MVAMRINENIHNIIGPQQTGYVPGRFIGMNLWKLIDLLCYLEKEEIAVTLILVDFEKCFDSINHNSLHEMLRYFNVSEYIISWIQLLYNKF